MTIVKRHLEQRIERALTSSRVVNIVGPRQVGKTTLVRDLMETAYFTLDDDAVRGALEIDPYGQLRFLTERHQNLPIVLDEVQRLPQITLALKRLVDEDPRPGRFILTGSADIFTTAKAYDSLAGRVMTLTLRPLSAAEIEGAGPCRLLDLTLDEEALGRTLPEPRRATRDDVIDLVVRGGFPEIRGLDDADRMDRYASYLDSIVERDVAPLAAVRKPDVLRRLLDHAAARTAQELNVATLCNLLDIRKETVSTYLDIFARLGLIHRLGAWTSSETRKEIKASKLHFLDTGCVTALRGEDSRSFGFGTSDLMALGPLVETFVFDEIEKSLPYQSKRWRLYHWRSSPHEIDLLAEAPGGRLALFESKAVATVTSNDFRHIDWFFREGPGRDHLGVGFVLYLGDKVLPFGPGRFALPISTLWSFPV